MVSAVERTSLIYFQMTPLSKLLRELIALPSVNPAFLPAGDVRAGEWRVAEFLATAAKRAGLETESREVFPGRANTFVHLAPSNKVRQHLVLAPHVDTVGEPGMSATLFNPREKNGRLYGRGACDTKGSVAAMFSAVLQVASSGQR